MTDLVTRDEATGLVLGGPENIQKAWRMLAGSATTAVETLVRVMTTSENDAAAVAAANSLLNRTGLTTSQEITFRAVPAEYDQAASTDTHTPPSEIIARRLAELAASDEAIDAEIVEATFVDE